ncbi:hypothetical protein IAT38_007881 [Cryptococcus sp. DSM 104549]
MDTYRPQRPYATTSPYHPSPAHSAYSTGTAGTGTAPGSANTHPSPLGASPFARYPNALSDSIRGSIGSSSNPRAGNSNMASSRDNIYGRGADAYPASWAAPGAVHDRDGKEDRGWGSGVVDRGVKSIPGPPAAQHQQPAVFPSTGPTAKRGSRACTACRKGKNRCEWDPSGSEAACRRCLLNGTQCVLAQPTEKAATRARATSSVAASDMPGDAEHRVSSLERTVQNLTQSQDQIQNTLQQILSLLPHNQALPTPTTSLPSFLPQDTNAGVHPSSIFPSSVSPPEIFGPNANGEGRRNDSISSAQAGGYQAIGQERPRSPQNTASGRGRSSVRIEGDRRKKEDFPALPGFAPPNHRFGTYGIIPLPSAPPSPSRSRHSSRSSSSSRSGEYSTALPRETLTAPIQALQALANAADQAAAIVDKDRGVGGTGGMVDGGRDEGEVEAEGREPYTRKATDNERRNGEDEEEDGAGGEDRGRQKKRKRVTIDGKDIHLRVKKKTRPDPTPRNPFPDVVTKGLVSEDEARDLWDIFFSGCHYFVPLWDKSYDTFETYIERTPFSTNGLLAVAAKIRAGNGPLGKTFHRCLEEAQGIARSTLFGPIVRKEAVMAMLILSAWSQNGWLPCGHALRMGLDMNLHRALDKLANKDEDRSEYDERDFVVSARIWLNCYMHEHLVSLGTGKPLLLRDDSSVRNARDLLAHPMASETDMRLIAGVELVNLRISILEHLTPLHGKADASTISYVRGKLQDLRSWYDEWYAIHRMRYDDESVLVKLLETELVYAEMWTVCVALRGCSWDKLSPDQKELAFQAKDSASRCLEIFLLSDNFRRHLKYATHDQLVSVAFAAVFLLKIAILYPTSLSIPLLISQVSQLAHLLSAECFAERYALTLRLMLSNFRRATGALSTVPGTPRLAAGGVHGLHGLSQLPMTPLNGAAGANGANGAPGGQHAIRDLEGGLQSLLSLPQMTGHLDGVGGDDSLGGAASGDASGAGAAGTGAGLWDMPGLEGFDWPIEFSPSALPVWLQDGNATDLGLPQDGSDSLFLPLELANMFLPSGAQSNALYQFSLPDSGDVGAEAW